MATNSNLRVQSSGQGSALPLALLLFLVVAGLFYGGNVFVEIARDFKKHLLEVKQEHKEAVANNEKFSREINRTKNEMEEVKKEADLWKKLDDILKKPWTSNAVGWLSQKARDQQPPATTDTATSSAATEERRGNVSMKLHGDFRSLLNWLMSAEHELDMLRVMEASWNARSSRAVELTVKFEVDNEGP